jgi:hypothetical protein
VHLAFVHGWLLFAGSWNYPNVISTLPRLPGGAVEAGGVSPYHVG